MPRHLEHTGLGLSFDMPDIRQRDAEALMQTERALRRARVVAQQDVIETIQEDVRAALVSAMKRNLRPNTDDLTALVQTTARVVLSRLTTPALDDITDVETAGIWARAMARLGWLGKMGEDEVGDLTPAAVLWLARQLLDVLVEARTIPNA